MFTQQRTQIAEILHHGGHLIQLRPAGNAVYNADGECVMVVGNQIVLPMLKDLRRMFLASSCWDGNCYINAATEVPILFYDRHGFLVKAITRADHSGCHGSLSAGSIVRREPAL